MLSLYLVRVSLLHFIIFHLLFILKVLLCPTALCDLNTCDSPVECVATVLMLVMICSQILYNNQAHSGRIKVDLDSDVEINECTDWSVTGGGSRLIYDIITMKGGVELNAFWVHLTPLPSPDPPGDRNPYFPMLFDVLIIVTCITSLALCTRSVLNGIKLQIVGLII